MKSNELKEKSVVELNEILTDLLKQQFGLRMQHATGQLGQTGEIKRIRRDIARVRTIISEKGVQ